MSYSSLKFSDLVDDLETTDGLAVRATVVARRIDVTTVGEVQAVRVVIVRRSRPTGAAVADIAQTANAVAATTQSRVPDGRSTTELAGEVHAFV